MKKLRITPLNIIVAIALVFFVASFFQTDTAKGHVDFSVFYKVILGGIVVVAFISDMIFRFVFKHLKRIWLVELLFMALTVILFLILQKFYF